MKKIPLQNLVLNGTSAKNGALTGAAVEVELTQGIWSVFADRIFNCQLNDESGQGFGANPVVWFGEQPSSPYLYEDVQQLPIYVGVGQTKYLMLKKYAGELDGTYRINFVAGPV